MDSNFKNAVDDLVVGLGSRLTKNQEYEYQHIDEVINNLKLVKEGSYYLYALPKDFVSGLLKGKHVVNAWKRKCLITNCYFVSEKQDYCLLLKWESGNKTWKTWLKTAINDFTWIDFTKKTKDKYFKKLDKRSLSLLMDDLNHKKQKYASWYKQNTKRSNNIIGRELSKHQSTIQVTREAIRKSIRSIQQDSKVIADAWNSTLTKEEQSNLIKWLASNIYSMRLYVTKDSRWDKALCELYPETIYGKHRQTEASELSKDSINGYISLSSIKDIPYDILKKITHKEKEEDIIKQNKGSSKFRINNYLLVLYLLNNYNKNGFKLGKTGLNKDIILG